ncbi:MAG: glutamate--tRNA ligase [Christensenella sp.]|nr:MAG: glutamate--tRNA ligase [Christensenella sp.]
MSDTVRTRFAPSPTGFMHIGNLRTGLYAYLFARKNNGKFILRIEDTDQERKVEGAIEMVYRTLATAGITYDEGPDKDGGVGPYIQTERMAIYKEYAKKLVELGGAYYCFCDKERLESLQGEGGVHTYDKHCRNLSKEEVERRLAAGESYVIRQKVPEGVVSSYDDMVFGTISVDTADIEDGILLKSDGLPTYNFANVVDDHLMGITHVIRGTEYLSSTPKYNLIYDAFGWERPKYMHLPPIMKDATRKLSKRFGDANFEDFIAKGYLPEAVVNYIALLGWCPKDNKEKMSMQEMIDEFDVSGISHSSSIFDEAKMRWLNGEYLKAMSAEDFKKVATPWIEKAIDGRDYDVKELALLMQTRVDILSEIPEKLAFLNEFGEHDLAMYEHQKMKVDREVAKRALGVAIAALEDFNDWNADAIKEQIKAKSEEEGIKSGQVMFTMRVALTGAPVTPGGAIEMAVVLRKDETLRRMKYSLSLLQKA